MGGTATPAEHKEFHERQSVVIEKILKMPIDELFITKEVKPELPVRAKIFASVPCAKCGEMAEDPNLTSVFIHKECPNATK